MKMIKFLTFALCIASFYLSKAQFDSTAFKQAENYYAAENYIKTREILDELISKDSTSSEAFRMRGTCYFHFEQLEKAISDYKQALKIGSESTSIYYNLGGAYEELELLDSAARYFLTYVRNDTTDGEGYLRLANVHRQQGKYDSLRLLLDRSYALDSTNLSTIYYLAQEYLIANEFEAAVGYCKAAKKIEPLDISFYLLQGVASFGMKDFQGAVAQSDSAILLDPLSIDAITLNLESKMLNVSNPEDLVFKEGNEYALKNLNSNTIKGRLESLSTDDYVMLFEQIKAGEVLSLEGYINFYLLQSTQSNYSPYSSKDKKISNLYSQGKVEELAKLSDEVFEANPLLLDDILLVAEANFAQQNADEFKKLYAVYFGILESILATGDGKSYESAYIAMSTKDEYSILYYLGRRSLRQSLIHEKGHSYDVLRTVDSNENESDLYFNIDRPWSGLAKSFGGGKDKKKKKKKKKN